MQTLAAGLAGATCSQVVQCSTGICTSEATRNIGGLRCVDPVFSFSRSCFLRLNSHGNALRTHERVHGVMATLPSMHLVKAAATAEDETLDLLTLEAQPRPEQVTAIEEEIVAVEEDTRPKTSVKFVLQKECHFGQQFNVVGEIPELGEWDPSRAVPMVWSEGHVWSAEVRIPVGLTVEYKFVMTGKRLELEWQPGENKVFETNDESDITVSGFWEESSPVEDSHTDITGEGDGTTRDGSETKEVAFTNGLATASADFVEKALIIVEEAADEVTTSGSIDTVSGDEAEHEQKPEEIPVVDAALATLVAEVSGEVEDAAASKEI